MVQSYLYIEHNNQLLVQSMTEISLYLVCQVTDDFAVTCVLFTVGHRPLQRHEVAVIYLQKNNMTTIYTS